MVQDQALCSSLFCHGSEPLSGHCCHVSGWPICPFLRPNAKKGCFESRKGNDFFLWHLPLFCQPKEISLGQEAV